MTPSSRDELTKRLSLVFVEVLANRSTAKMRHTEEAIGAETWLHFFGQTARHPTQIDVMLCLPGLPMISVKLHQQKKEVRLRFSGNKDKTAATISRRYYALIEGAHSRRKHVTTSANELAMTYAHLQLDALLALLERSTKGAIIRPTGCWLAD